MIILMWLSGICAWLFSIKMIIELYREVEDYRRKKKFRETFFPDQEEMIKSWKKSVELLKKDLDKSFTPKPSKKSDEEPHIH